MSYVDRKLVDALYRDLIEVLNEKPTHEVMCALQLIMRDMLIAMFATRDESLDKADIFIAGVRELIDRAGTSPATVAVPQ